MSEHIGVEACTHYPKKYYPCYYKHSSAITWEFSNSHIGFFLHLENFMNAQTSQLCGKADCILCAKTRSGFGSVPLDLLKFELKKDANQDI